MIALVLGSNGGGGDGDPVFFTVPWSPMIADRGGELPGAILAAIRRRFALMDADNEIAQGFRNASDGYLLMLMISGPNRYDLPSALGVLAARKMALELEMFPSR